ncbi:MAG: succinate dehydrogenase cytochrome b subunit [Verrucomicrobia bacterium]|nr:succinate dehydrogenase cytochrome b subunit [Verrucomicrobiota bacterium]
MNILFALYKSSVGKKYIVAATGFLLFIFLIGHLLGNLQIYMGAEKLNAYAHFLQTKPLLIWASRAGLLLIALVHVTTTIKLALENKAARPVGYEVSKAPYAPLTARSILVSGIIIGLFVVYHILHFTSVTFNPEFSDLRAAHNVYGMVVAGFSNTYVSAFYIISMVLLFMHLRHGISSFFQTFGMNNKTYRTTIERLAVVAAGLVFLGNISIPLVVLLGFIK